MTRENGRCFCEACWRKLAADDMADEIAARGAVTVEAHTKVTDADVMLLVIHRNAMIEDDPARRKQDWLEWCPGRWIDFNGGGWTWEGLCGIVTHVAKSP
jgi:hypothetical protein